MADIASILAPLLAPPPPPADEAERKRARERKTKIIGKLDAGKPVTAADLAVVSDQQGDAPRFFVTPEPAGAAPDFVVTPEPVKRATAAPGPVRIKEPPAPDYAAESAKRQAAREQHNVQRAEITAKIDAGLSVTPEELAFAAGQQPTMGRAESYAKSTAKGAIDAASSIPRAAGVYQAAVAGGMLETLQAPKNIETAAKRIAKLEAMRAKLATREPTAQTEKFFADIDAEIVSQENVIASFEPMRKKAVEIIERRRAEGLPDKPTADEYAAFRLGKGIQSVADDIVGAPDAAYAEDWWTGFFEGVGQFGVGIAAGVAGAPVLGGAAMSAQMPAAAYDEAKQLGATEADAQLAAILNSPLALTEFVPLLVVLRKAGVSPNAAKRILARGVQGAVAEGIQETVQTIGENVIASDPRLVGFDPARPWHQDVAKAGSIGAGVGGAAGVGVEGLRSGFRRRARGGANPTPISEMEARDAALAEAARASRASVETDQQTQDATAGPVGGEASAQVKEQARAVEQAGAAAAAGPDAALATEAATPDTDAELEALAGRLAQGQARRDAAKKEAAAKPAPSAAPETAPAPTVRGDRESYASQPLPDEQIDEGDSPEWIYQPNPADPDGPPLSARPVGEAPSQARFDEAVAVAGQPSASEGDALDQEIEGEAVSRVDDLVDEYRRLDAVTAGRTAHPETRALRDAYDRMDEIREELGHLSKLAVADLDQESAPKRPGFADRLGVDDAVVVAPEANAGLDQVSAAVESVVAGEATLADVQDEFSEADLREVVRQIGEVEAPSLAESDPDLARERDDQIARFAATSEAADLRDPADAIARLERTQKSAIRRVVREMTGKPIPRGADPVKVARDAVQSAEDAVRLNELIRLDGEQNPAAGAAKAQVDAAAIAEALNSGDRAALAQVNNRDLTKAQAVEIAKAVTGKTYKTRKAAVEAVHQKMRRSAAKRSADRSASESSKAVDDWVEQFRQAPPKIVYRAMADVDLSPQEWIEIAKRVTGRDNIQDEPTAFSALEAWIDKGAPSQEQPSGASAQPRVKAAAETNARDADVIAARIQDMDQSTETVLAEINAMGERGSDVSAETVKAVARKIIGRNYPSKAEAAGALHRWRWQHSRNLSIGRTIANEGKGKKAPAETNARDNGVVDERVPKVAPRSSALNDLTRQIERDSARRQRTTSLREVQEGIDAKKRSSEPKPSDPAMLRQPAEQSRPAKGSGAITASKSVPDFIVRALEKFHKGAQTDAKIEVVAVEDATGANAELWEEVKAEARVQFGGQKDGAIGLVDPAGTIRAVMKPRGPGDYVIFLPESFAKQPRLRQIEYAAHEYGHVLEAELFDSADGRTKQALVAEWRKAGLQTNRDVLEKSLPVKMRQELARLFGAESSQGGQAVEGANETASAYAASFSEWFANQISRALSTSDSAIAALEETNQSEALVLRWFKKLAQIWRRLARELRGAGYANARVVNWLKSVGVDPTLSAKRETAGADSPVLRYQEAENPPAAVVEAATRVRAARKQAVAKAIKEDRTPGAVRNVVITAEGAASPLKGRPPEGAYILDRNGKLLQATPADDQDVPTTPFGKLDAYNREQERSGYRFARTPDGFDYASPSDAIARLEREPKSNQQKIAREFAGKGVKMPRDAAGRAEWVRAKLSENADLAVDLNRAIDAVTGVASPTGSARSARQDQKAAVDAVLDMSRDEALALSGDDARSVEEAIRDMSLPQLRRLHAAWLGDTPARDAVMRDVQMRLREFVQQEHNAVAPAVAREESGVSVRTVTTPDGMKVQVRDRVVDAAELEAAAGDLQPRDRSRAASSEQIAAMAADLDPSRLMPAPEADRGAPIVMRQGAGFVVLSGNGRVAAIRRMYEQNPPARGRLSYGPRQQYLAAVRDAGHDWTQAKSSAPILVSEVVDDLSPEQLRDFVRGANTSAIARMSGSEQAQMDAAAVEGALDLYDGDASLTSGANRGFVRAVLSGMAQSERAALVDAGGALNADGVRRIESGLFAAAYSDAGLVALVAESTDNPAKSIVGAMKRVAGEWAATRRDAKGGRLKLEADLTPELIGAVRLITNAREKARAESRPVATVLRESLGQGDMFSGDVAPEVKALVNGFFADDRLTRPISEDRATEFLRGLIREIRATTSADASLFGDDLAVSMEDVINAAGQATGGVAGDLFADQAQDPGARAGEGIGEQGQRAAADGGGAVERDAGGFDELRKARDEAEIALRDIGAVLRQYPRSESGLTLESAKDDQWRSMMAQQERLRTRVRDINGRIAKEFPAELKQERAERQRQREADLTARRAAEAEAPLSKAEKVRRARDLGRAAFERGDARRPAGDPALEPLLKNNQVGEGIPVLDAWNAGWDQANLAAPVELAPERPGANEPASASRLRSAIEHWLDRREIARGATRSNLEGALRSVNDGDYEGAVLLSERAARNTGNEEINLWASRLRVGFADILGQEAANVQPTGENLERDRGDAIAPDRLGATDVPAPAGQPGLGAVEGVGQDRGGDGRPDRGAGVSRSDAASLGERGDREVRGENRGEPDAVPERGRGNDRGDPGSASDFLAATEAEAKAARDAGVNTAAGSRLRVLAEAERVKVVPRDEANIAATLPLLQPAQRDDVLKAEDRFATAPNGESGILFTNSTGTGKTFTALGVAKRFARQGKTNILIVAPSDKIMGDWQKTAADFFDLDLSILPNTKTAGEGPVLTTYAGLGQNDALAERDWDLVIADESHYLNNNQSGGATRAQTAFRAITNHPDSLRQRATMRLQAAGKIQDVATDDPNRDAKLKDRDRAINAEQEKLAGAERSKVVFLSATPFAYVKNVDYAEGYLFSYDREAGKNTAGRYNAPDAQEAFMIQHFGFRMRTGKLTQPDAEVDSSVMERQFHEHLKSTGALSGRQLEVDADYERRFAALENAEGAKIDQALEWLATEKGGRYRAVLEAVMENFTYLRRRQLLEAIKAKELIPTIEKLRAEGRKVVVYHDYNVGGGFNPFALTSKDGFNLDVNREVKTGSGDETVKIGLLFAEFVKANPYVKGLNFAAYAPPVEALTGAFPDALVFNGKQSKKERRTRAEQFNRDGGDALMIVQSDAGAEGISLHDTSGRHKRVLINLGMPSRPTRATQIEGRIYRVGQVTDALMLYPTTGSAWERAAFAGSIAERAATAENLAMGEQARGLRDSFVDGYAEADVYEPSETDGRGGKERDRTTAKLSSFENAKSFYFGQGKKRGRRDQREGADYYATPEPVGLKMVELADLKFAERALEPSAGHGAIARWFPDGTQRTVIEPSPDLASRAALASPGAKMVTDTFENHNLVNKYDAIVMNPPFGQGGATAISHLAKAYRHLKNGGRIVALLPRGPAADARFDKFYSDERVKGLHIVAEIKLPPSTFERAGTKIATRIVVMEKQTDASVAEKLQSVRRDYSDAENIGDLFDRIENLEIAPRLEPLTKDQSTPTEGKVEAGPITFEVKTQKNGKVAAKMTGYVPYLLARQVKAAAENVKAEAVGRRGFKFQDQAASDAFFADLNERLSEPEAATPAPAPTRAPADSTAPEAAQAAAPGVTFKTAETVHSKTGENLFVATFEARQERAVFDRVSAIAKRHGGYYSAFRGFKAVPGFQFKSETARRAFIQEVNGAQAGDNSLGAEIRAIVNEFGLSEFQMDEAALSAALERIRGLPSDQQIAVAQDLTKAPPRRLSSEDARIQEIRSWAYTAQRERNRQVRKSTEGSRFAIAGPGAAGADLSAKAQAEKMLAAGDSARQIWRATGWSDTAAGLRYEIDPDAMQWAGDEAELRAAVDDAMDEMRAIEADKTLSTKEKRAKLDAADAAGEFEIGEMRVDQLFSYDPLFDAYPQLRSVPISVHAAPERGGATAVSGGGAVNSIAIWGPDPANLKRAARHELQEAANWIEGVQGQDVDPDVDFILYFRQPTDVVARNAETRAELSRGQRRRLPLGETEDLPRALVGDRALSQGEIDVVDAAASDWLAGELPAGVRRALKRQQGATKRQARFAMSPPKPNRFTRWEDLDALGLFSQPLRLVEASGQSRNAPDGWSSWLKKQPGVTKEEMDVLGWDAWIEERKAAGVKSLTREEVAEFIRSNQPVVEERVLSEAAEGLTPISTIADGDSLFKRWEAGGEQVRIEIAAAEGGGFEVHLANDARERVELIGRASTQSEANHIAQGRAVDILTERGVGDRLRPAKFSQYAVPGGEPGSYREILVRDPSLGPGGLSAAERAEMEAIRARVESGGDASSDEFARYNELVGADATGRYTSKHFNDQELLHLRVDDRTGPNGERILFINELQSDLHQAGRREGYFSDGPPDPADRAKLAPNAVPDAPFKGDHWIHLGLKVALRRAIDEGYDAISWSRSDQIAEAVGESRGALSTLYETKIPSFLKKYTKSWGGKVEEAQIVRDAELRVRAESEAGVISVADANRLRAHPDFGKADSTNPLLRIPPEMREAISENGQARFAMTPTYDPVSGPIGQDSTGMTRTEYRARFAAYAPILQAPTQAHRTPGELTSWLDRRRAHIQDAFIAPMRMVDEMERRIGQTPNVDDNVYLQEKNYAGRVGDKQSEIEFDFVEPIIEILGETGLSMDELQEYLANRHAPERNAQIARINPAMPDGGSGINTADAQAVIQRYESGPHAAQLRQINRLLRRMRAQALRWRVQNGLMSRAQAQAWMRQYKYYVPLKGWDDMSQAPVSAQTTSEANLPLGGGKTYSVRGPESRRALGRGAGNLAADPFIQAVVDVEEAAIRSEKNRILQSLLRLARNPVMQDFVEEIRVQHVRRYNPSTGLVEMVARSPLTAREALDTVTVKEDGLERRIQIKDPDLLRAFKQTANVRMEGIMGALSAYSRFFSASVTSWNPAFWLVNMSRDLGAFAFTAPRFRLPGMRRAMMRHYFPAMRAGWNAVRDGDYTGEYGRWFKRFQRAGGKISFFDLGGVQSKGPQLRRQARATAGGLTLGDYRTFAHVPVARNIPIRGVYNGLSGFFDRVEGANVAIDNALRLAVFRHAVESGRSDTEAAAMARDVTVDFNKKGFASAFVNALFPFTNAGIQGTETLLRAVISRPVQVNVGVLVMLGMVQELLHAAIGDEDDDGQLVYDKMSDYELEHHAVLMLGGEPVKIPLQYGVNIPFNLGRVIGRSIRKMGGDDRIPDWTHGKAAASVANVTAEAFLPMWDGWDLNTLAPTILDPVVDVATNETFTGGSIRPETPWDVGPQSQEFYPGVTELSRRGSEMLNWATGGTEFEAGAIDISPEYFDHISKTLAGGAGAFVYRAYELGEKAVTGDLGEAENRDIPIFRRFRPEVGVFRDRMMAYDRLREADAALHIVKGVIGKLHDEGKFTLPDSAFTKTGAVKKRAALGILKRMSQARAEKVGIRPRAYDMALLTEVSTEIKSELSAIRKARIKIDRQRPANRDVLREKLERAEQKILDRVNRYWLNAGRKHEHANQNRSKQKVAAGQ